MKRRCNDNKYGCCPDGVYMTDELGKNCKQVNYKSSKKPEYLPDDLMWKPVGGGTNKFGAFRKGDGYWYSFINGQWKRDT